MMKNWLEDPFFPSFAHSFLPTFLMFSLFLRFSSFDSPWNGCVPCVTFLSCLHKNAIFPRLCSPLFSNFLVVKRHRQTPETTKKLYLWNISEKKCQYYDVLRTVFFLIICGSFWAFKDEFRRIFYSIQISLMAYKLYLL